MKNRANFAPACIT